MDDQRKGMDNFPRDGFYQPLTSIKKAKHQGFAFNSFIFIPS